MGTVPLRGALTDWLLEQLRTLAFPVGDGIAPREGGWTGGQPNAGTFTAYAVLGTASASPNNRDPVGDENSSWALGYTLRGVGTVRGQAEWVCDASRQLVSGLTRTRVVLELGADRWRLIRVSLPTLGAITRNDATDPALWECQDALTLWLERSRT